MITDNETGEFWVEIFTGNMQVNRGWELWSNVIGIRDAKDELEDIKDHGFSGRILDAEGSVLCK